MDKQEKVKEYKKKIYSLFDLEESKDEYSLKKTKIAFIEILKIINENITEEEKERVQNSVIIFCLFEKCSSCKKNLKNFKELENEDLGCPLLSRGVIKNNTPKIIAKTCVGSENFELDDMCKKMVKCIEDKLHLYSEKGFLSLIFPALLIAKKFSKNFFGDEMMGKEFYKLFENLTGLKI